jgi:hypothetical protein
MDTCFTSGRTGLTVIARLSPGDVKASAAVVVTLLIFEFVCLFDFALFQSACSFI